MAIFCNGYFLQWLFFAMAIFCDGFDMAKKQQPKMYF